MLVVNQINASVITNNKNLTTFGLFYVVFVRKILTIIIWFLYSIKVLKFSIIKKL